MVLTAGQPYLSFQLRYRAFCKGISHLWNGSRGHFVARADALRSTSARILVLNSMQRLSSGRISATDVFVPGAFLLVSHGS